MPKPLSTPQLSLLLAAIISLTPFSIDAYLPALSQISRDLGTDLHHLELTVSSFFIGYAFGSLVGGPLSDHKGRRLVAGIGLLCFMVASLAITMCESFESLLLLRFLQAASGGVTTVVVPAIVRDRFPRQQAAQVMSTIAFIMMAAPLVAPIVGSAILATWGWRPIFLFLAVYGLALYLLTRAFMPESRPNGEPPSAFSLKKTLSVYRFVLSHRQARPFLLIIVCSNAIFFSYLTQAAYLLYEYMGVTELQFPMVFSGFVVCLMIANRCNAFLLRTHDSLQILRWGLMAALIVASALLVAALFTGPGSLWVMGFVLLLISSLGFVNSNSQVNFLHFFGENSGTAASAMRASQMLVGASAGALVSALYNGTPVPLACVMLFMAGCAFVSMRKAGIAVDCEGGVVSP
ncbi:multidrug effflux MFS transporter [Granulosicoccus antarcticus]|uniref:Bcr/CflA family efflux transporter n=1 Tax=Granulosicoccus antarcticus IMCC3135 TaxID=1192854 RepID=A0A2Z2NRH7_9GAMM|nr:multidrug effflux MFS transporter [Granulosicoccus antarcticus]ASJ73839.1 Bicyclomycin resistance protein [Granulosicoccus antarcticus IMCC3135]